MCKVLALEVNHAKLKDTFIISLDSKKNIKFDFDKSHDTVVGILNELVCVIDDELDEFNIEKIKADMNVLLTSKRIGGIYYDE